MQKMIYQNNNLLSTNQIIQNESYFSTSELFFSNFANAWKNVKYQVLKIESRQNYDEPGNISYEAFFVEGKTFDESVNLINYNREQDKAFYSDLLLRGINFNRCRPIKRPISDYIFWELHCYSFNSINGENIFISDLDNPFINELYNNYINHDFMIFDNNLAFVHNYDSNGLIQGGWKIDNVDKIFNLILLFSLSKSNSVDWLKYIKQNNIRLIDYEL